MADKLPAAHLRYAYSVERWYVYFRRWLGLRYVRQHPSATKATVDIGLGQYVKVTATLNEVMAMQYIQKHAVMPMPEVHRALRRRSRDNRYYLIMSRVPGVPLREIWATMHETARSALADQVHAHLQTLRDLEQPLEVFGQICGASGAEFKDAGLSCFEPRGPYETAHDMINKLLEPVEYFEPHLVDKFRQILTPSSPDRLYLTHGDLHASNIIVDPKTSKLSGIIDFGTCSWSPIYWEAYKAVFLQEEEELPGWAAFTKRMAGSYDEQIETLFYIRGLSGTI